MASASSIQTTLTDGVRELISRQGAPLNRMTLLTLQMALGSSVAVWT